jgi:hypothetical protein
LPVQADFVASAIAGDVTAAVAPAGIVGPVRDPAEMVSDETLADYAATGLTHKPHLLAHLRAALKAAGVLSTTELAQAEHGAWVKVAGAVIVRQRPATAKGFLFLSLEDENGIANVIVTPSLFERHRALLSHAGLLQVEGPLQKVEGVIHVRARRFRELTLPAMGANIRKIRVRYLPFIQANCCLVNYLKRPISLKLAPMPCPPSYRPSTISIKHRHFITRHAHRCAAESPTLLSEIATLTRHFPRHSFLKESLPSVSLCVYANLYYTLMCYLQVNTCLQL